MQPPDRRKSTTTIRVVPLLDHISDIATHDASRTGGTKLNTAVQVSPKTPGAATRLRSPGVQIPSKGVGASRTTGPEPSKGMRKGTLEAAKLTTW
ncbi:hypothetical protein DICSQDRAFT_132887 [Dichomitus squalens LYAD-421 SS1]|uniref:uncharacterized protein n=1 Tax=Dichomitus squalens (strain LYAD-421) TaxID=732165 RepID=UPI0004411274|nr:uncharacterized protein DICSQDRAFT_132887 [Dichomitus squalens LYAD-421 SS1]EJF65305.1 hypothetical protein DICSQDRAFT_132887 [Dichomitus squalens LYAD-421 SS1]